MIQGSIIDLKKVAVHWAAMTTRSKTIQQYKIYKLNFMYIFKHFRISTGTQTAHLLKEFIKKTKDIIVWLWSRPTLCYSTTPPLKWQRSLTSVKVAFSGIRCYSNHVSTFKWQNFRPVMATRSKKDIQIVFRLCPILLSFRIFGRKSEFHFHSPISQIAGRMGRRLHNEELHGLYRSPNIVTELSLED